MCFLKPVNTLLGFFVAVVFLGFCLTVWTSFRTSLPKSSNSYCVPDYFSHLESMDSAGLSICHVSWMQELSPKLLAVTGWGILQQVTIE